MALSYEEQLRRNGVTQADIDRITAQVQGGSVPNPNLPPARGEDFAGSYEQAGLDKSAPIATPNYTSNADPFLYQSQNSASGYAITPVPTLTYDQAKGFASSNGLAGLGKEKDFTGLTSSQAAAKAAELKDFYKKQTSANTSYTYNPESISKVNKTINDMKFKVDETNNDPWVNNGQKKMTNEATVNSYTDQLSKLFSNVEEFNAASSDVNFQNTLKKYELMGGNVSNIVAGISKNTNPSVTGETVNPDGSQTSVGAQTIDQYLGKIKNPEEQKAFDSLIPEKSIYQDQIAFEQNIPEKYKELYFGSEERVGLVQQKRQQAEETVKLLERKAENEKADVRAQAELAVAKNNAQMDIEEAQIEENRLAAKNYITGQLAKLGALQTTGAAPVALANLEQKYQAQSQRLRTSYDLSNKDMQVTLNTKIKDIDLERDGKILDTKSNLSKSEEEVFKEIFKLQNTADSKTFELVTKYAQDFRTQTEKYSKEAKAEAEKYAKSLKKTISTYDTDSLTLNSFVKAQQNQGNVGIPYAKGADTSSYVPDFIQNLLKRGQVSLDLQAVLSGESKLSDYTPSVQTKVQREMTKLGISKKMIGQESKPKAEEEFGAISKDDQKKGLNFLQNNNAPQANIDRFKTDREFQAYILKLAKEEDN